MEIARKNPIGVPLIIAPGGIVTVVIRMKAVKRM